MKIGHFLCLFIILSACRTQQDTCSELGLESYQHLASIDQEIALRVAKFDEAPPEDLMSDENYQSLQTLKASRDRLVIELQELRNLEQACQFQPPLYPSEKLNTELNDPSTH